MSDIVPELINKVNEDFEYYIRLNVDKIKPLLNKIKKGTATYNDAYKYAELIGQARSKALQRNMDMLPDGTMYYNIADRLMTDSLTTDFEMVAEYSKAVQDIANEKAGISIKALSASSPELDKDRIRGFINGLCGELGMPIDTVIWKLGEPIVVHAMSVVDDTIKKNAEFQNKAGIDVTVIRRAAGNCCEWCKQLEGKYTYPGVPNEVFMRHDNCRCTVDYKGKRLTAYVWRDPNSIWGVRDSHTFREENGL